MLQSPSSKHLVLQGHVRLWLKANAGAEDVGQCSALLSQGIYDWCAGRSQWGLLKLATISTSTAPRHTLSI